MTCINNDVIWFVVAISALIASKTIDRYRKARKK